MILAEKTRPITLVVSKGQSRNPAKRALEQAIAEAAGKITGIDVLTVPHLYDLPKNGESVSRLRQIEGDVILASWIFPRAAHWVLDRNGIGGRPGDVRLGNHESDGDSQQEGDVEQSDLEQSDVEQSDLEQGDQEVAEQATSFTGDHSEEQSEEPTQRMTDLFPRPDRRIFCIDLRVSESTSDFIGEVHRILELQSDLLDPASHRPHTGELRSLPVVGGQIESVEETTGRRW